MKSPWRFTNFANPLSLGKLLLLLPGLSKNFALYSVSPGDIGLEGEAQDDEDRGYGVSGVSPVTRVGRWGSADHILGHS
ncbi:hypothetical protein DY000_02028953 [Brassica cretica]|uniref:Uncharacterized protein n=1 Tax=Brassica cretica TaxID=69181 RepID=A0ABQ7DNE2_BRACR|nr:hypothetical protein DY000_02028953 [Brassica cretica]